MIPYGRQQISEDDISAVVSVLRSDFLTQGPAVARFEEAIAARCGIADAVAVNSATSALHIACMALGLGPGDRLWTVPNTFVASANCGRYCGATVDFVEIDPATYNMDTVSLEKKLIEAEQNGTLPRIVIPVHFGGQSCDMQRIAELARRFKFSVIEDASHAIGGSYLDKPVGCCEFSDITVFSFHPVKIITTGEGGAAVTADANLAQSMRELRTHGITRDPSRMERNSEGGWYYEQHGLGYNYRMTDISAALGESQLTRLDGFLERRRALAARYDTILAGSPVKLPGRIEGASSSWHLYVVRVPADVGGGRAKVYERMRAAGIGVNVHYIAVHLQPYYLALGFGPGDFPASELYSDEALTLPLHAGLTDEQQDTVVHALLEATH